MTSKNGFKAAKKKPAKAAAVKHHNRLAVLLFEDDLDRDANEVLFDSYVFPAQEKRFKEVIETIGRLPVHPNDEFLEVEPIYDPVASLARDLDRLLHNPECPGGLYSAIEEYLIDLENRTEVTNSLQSKYLVRWLPDAITELKKQAKKYKAGPELREGPYGAVNWSVQDMQKLQKGN